MSGINDATLTPDERVAALAELVAGGIDLPQPTVESNNHIHTIFSFSPYTPTMACLRGRQAGLSVVGSVDHDSIAAAAEMRSAAALLGLGVVTGFECRAKLHSAAEVAAGQAPFDQVKINNPDSPGVAYLTVQGIPQRSRAAVDEFLLPIRLARVERTRKMADAALEILASVSAPAFDFERDVLGASQFAAGGTVTERHLLYAMANALITGFGRGPALLSGLRSMGLEPSAKVGAVLGEEDNPYLAYDLLGVLKAEYLDRFYLQPTRLSEGGELPDAVDVVSFALRIGAIPCYAYLGDVTASPTGDKKAERFEDEYLDELVAHLAQLGFPAITYMPPRNTAEQLDRLARLCAKHALVEVSGVDINQPRQKFDCPELGEPRFKHLNTATWALVAHETLADAAPRLGLLSPENPLAEHPVLDRVVRYGELGQRLCAGEDLAKLIEDLERK